MTSELYPLPLPIADQMFYLDFGFGFGMWFLVLLLVDSGLLMVVMLV